MYIQETENSCYIPYFTVIQRMIQLLVHVYPGNGQLVLHPILYSHKHMIQLFVHVHPGNGKFALHPILYSHTTRYTTIRTCTSRKRKTRVTSHTLQPYNAWYNYSYMYIQETENSRFISYFTAIQRMIQLLVHVHPGNGKLVLHPILYSHTTHDTTTRTCTSRERKTRVTSHTLQP